MPDSRPVGVFDSGVGGLTVLHELLVQLPHEDFLYLADAARLPYGTRTQAELERFALQCAEELLARGAKLLVVACNSATAAALPALRERMAQTTLGIDVLGVVQPGAVQAVAARDVSALVPRGEDGSVQWALEPARVRAPVAAGDTVGTIVVKQGETEIGRVPALAAAAVERRPWWRFWGG